MSIRWPWAARRPPQHPEVAASSPDPDWWWRRGSETDDPQEVANIEVRRAVAPKPQPGAVNQGNSGRVWR